MRAGRTELKRGQAMVESILALIVVLLVFLALFNLNPIYPLDGSKILKWNPTVYVVTAVIAVALLALFYI